MNLHLPLAVIAALALCVAADDPPKPASAPASQPAQATSGAATLADLGFLAGAWRGRMGEDFVEELWSAPHGQSMMGCFRWVDAEGIPAMFEMLTISQEADAIRLRLRHYTPALTAKEDADKPMTLALKERSPTRALFVADRNAGILDRITYEVKGDELAIAVAFTQPTAADEKPRTPLRFALRR